MITLEKATINDASIFAGFELMPDTQKYILPYTPLEHELKIKDSALVYLRILAHNELKGFFILALEPDRQSIEFRRIVISEKGRGIGQLAIVMMEQYCRKELNRTRIWLDVFEDNSRGRHIYEKLGYVFFGENVNQGKKLLLYHKKI